MIKEFIIAQLPSIILESDSYKSGGKGFIERYLEIFGEELDQTSMVYLESFETQLGPYDVATAHLGYLEDMQGDVKNFGVTTHDRRKFLSYLVSIYDIKGSKTSIIQILSTRSIKVTAIQENIPVGSIYDNGVLYDSGVKYDDSCQSCSTLDITAVTKAGAGVNAAELVVLNQLLDLVLPVSTSIKSLNIT